MKKVFFAALLSLSSSFLFANSPLANTVSYRAINASREETKSVDMSLRSANGSLVSIVGMASFSLAPAGITTFTGTVTITGTGTPNGTLNFSIGGKVLTPVFDNQDVRRLNNVKWRGGPMATPYLDILNEAGINHSIVAAFNTFG